MSQGENRCSTHIETYSTNPGRMSTGQKQALTGSNSLRQHEWTTFRGMPFVTPNVLLAFWLSWLAPSASMSFNTSVETALPKATFFPSLWTERWGLGCLSEVCVYVWIYVMYNIYIYVCVCICLFIYPLIHPSIHLSLCVPVHVHSWAYCVHIDA